MSKRKIAYYVVTALFTVLLSLGIVMYFAKHADVVKAFTKLGYPTYIIYPLAIAKLLGLIAIWTKISPTLKEWAYAGFFFDLVLAIAAHVAIKDGEFFAAAIGLTLLLASYFLEEPVEAQSANA